MHVFQDLMDDIVSHGKDARFLSFAKQDKAKTLRFSLWFVGAFF